MRIRILFLLALMVVQSWTHPSYSYDSSVDAVTPQQQNNDNPERDGDSSKRIIGSSVVTSVSVILNGNEPEYTDALGMKVPKPQLPHLQVASPINLLNPDRYEFYTFDDNGDLVKRLMTMQEIQSIVANGDGDGPTIIHSAPIDDRDPEKNVQDIVKSVQSVLNREVESNKNSSDIQPILDTPDVSSSWSMILPAIFGNTGGDIFPQNKPQQVVMTPDSDVVEATTKATSNKRKPSSKPKPQKKKTNNRRKSTTKRVSTTTPIPDQEVEATEILESTTRKVFINNQEVVHAIEAGEPQQGENFSKRQPGIHRKPVSAHGGAKRPQSTKQKNKTKRPVTTSTTTTTTPEPTTSTTTTTTTPEPTTTSTSTTTTTTPEPTTTTTTTPEPTTSTTTTTTQRPTTTTTEAPIITTTAGVTEAATIPTEGTIVKVKPQKKRKKPTRKPSTTGPVIDVTTERHIGYLHKRKQTTPRPNIHHKPYYPEDESYVPVSHKHKVPPTTSTTTTSTTTTSAPTTTTTTTTTSAPTTTSTTTTTTTPAPTTTTTTSTTTTTTTPVPTTTTTTTTTPAPTTTTTTTTTPVPTTTTTTTPFTFATYRPTPPITSTPSYAPYRPRPTTSTSTTSAPVPTSTSGSYYAPDLIQQQFLEGYGIHSDFAPSLKKENVPMPGKDKEKEEDLNTKISFDQILQSLKEESATDNDMQASESEEVQLPARLPPSAYPSVANLEVENETPAPINDLPMTIASTNFESYDEMDELTSRPITQGKPTNSDESSEISDNNDGDNIKNNDEEEESPVVIITSRPQHHTSNKTVVPLIPDIPEVTTVFFESDYTTEKFNDQEKEQELEQEQEPETEQESTTLRKEDSVQDNDSAHVVKFEPLYADIAEPVVTTFTTTTPEPVSTTITDDFAYTDEEDITTNQPTTLPPMESIMQKIDSIISMSLKANGTLEMNNGQLPQSLPHISTMTMKDYKTQAATVASILEDNNTSQSSSETTVMNSSETKDEIQFLLSDVINQMTHSQQPTMLATTMPNIVAPNPHSNLNSNSSPNQDETAQRLSNFAQINPALQINAGALIQAPLREPTTVDESIEKVTSVSEDNSQPQEEDDIAPTTTVPSVENEPSFVLISQAGGDDSSASLNSAEEDKTQLTTTPAIEVSTQRVFQTTQRGYISSEEISKEKVSSEEKEVDVTTTMRPDSLSEDSTEEDGNEQMIIITSHPDVPEEEKSTEIPGETVVVLSDSDMEESSETPEFTTVVPSLQTSSHLLEGEDPYIKLGEIGAKPTVQSLAQVIYGQNSSPNQLPLAKEPVKIKEKSEEAEEGKIDQNPAIQESDILPKIDYSESAEPTKIDGKLDELLTGEQLSDKITKSSTPASVETQSIPELIQIVQSGKKPMMNMAQLVLEQSLMHATKVPVDIEDERITTVQSVAEKEISSAPTTSTPELPQLLETTQAPVITEEEKTSPTQAPTSTIPTKKIPNTLKPVSYFNKQPSLLNPDQKFNAFQAAQQRPVVRPASLSNLKMPQNTATRAPVKLEPSPVGSIGLEASVSGLEDDIQQFAQLCNELAFTYWRSITSEKISSARSLIISPFALTSMLSMVFLGARGSTSGEMNEVLKLDDMVTFNPHLVFKNITDSVEKATDSDIASSAFVREAFSDRANGKILQFFKEKTQQFYSGHVEEVNFHVVNDIIRRRTNLLVKRHTMGKVLEYLRTNSVWVNGPLATISANLYQTDCSRASINDRDGEMFFQVHPSIRQRRLVPIPAVLYRSGFTAGYEPNLDATVVAFGRTFDTVSTIYVMPGQQGPIAPADSLDILEKNLIETAFTKHAWRDLMTSLMERPNLEVQLPRFSHRSFVNASMGLQKMGLKGLFKSDLADLRGLTGLAAKDIYLSDMIQINTFSTCAEEKIGEHHHVEMYPAPPIRKRNKDVRENEAPEADSSESVIDFGSIVQDTAMARAFYDDLLDPKFLELPLPLRPRQARIPDAPRLRFDRPFLYFVRHNPTGMILFMGRFNPRLLP